MAIGNDIFKFILFFLNFCFFAVGVVLMAVGIAVKQNPDLIKYLEIANASGENPLFDAAIIFIAVLGAIIFIIAFFGCWGAFTKNKTMLKVYMALVLIMLILQLIGGILGAVFQNQVKGALDTTMADVVKNRFVGHNNNSLSAAWSSMQMKLKCCGANSPADWDKSAWHTANPNKTLPISCCVMKTDNTITPKDYPKCQSQNSAFFYNTGCAPKLIDFLKQNALIIMGCAFGLIVFEILVIVMAFFMVKNIDKE